MSATSRRGGNTEAVAVWAALGGGVLLLGVLWATCQLVHAALGGPRPAGNPVALAITVARGRFPLGPAHAVTAGGLLLAAAAAGLALFGIERKLRGRRERVDAAAAHLAGGQELAGLTTRGATATATRFGVARPGLPLGVLVAGAVRLWQDWESVAVWIIGPRGGKTMSAAIPAVLEAPGACLATSNKRDLVDATRDVRAGRGRVWVFDPMGIARERAGWWWNPLSYVTDEVQALKLARVLAAAAREPGARVDAYFDKAGPSLIAGLLYAAALDGRPITQVYDWLCDPLDYEPADILHRHGKTRSGRAVLAVNRAPEKQRGGVYGTAQELLSFLVSEAAAQWVTPAGGGRRQFDPAAFVRSADTLYLLSKEGDASTGPLVTALTVAVLEAATDLAETCPGGRLPVPLVCVLDEAANICRWHALPDLYSHFGSKGIAVITFLQSWSQGVDVWGREGMNKLWSAANLRVVGSGLAEAGFLEDLAKLVPTFWRRAQAGSRSRGVPTASWHQAEEPVLTAADLHRMPRGRAMLFSAGAGPALLRTVPWTAGPHEAAVKASLRAHDPGAAATIAEAEAARAATERDVPTAGSAWAA